MTRINVVKPRKLHKKHLGAEYREIVRVFSLVRDLEDRGITPDNYKKRLKVPDKYVLGKGHVTFFYDKLGYILRRYKKLTKEFASRGANVSPVRTKYLVEGIDDFWFKDYTPTKEAKALNKQRIKERPPKEKKRGKQK